MIKHITPPPMKRAAIQLAAAQKALQHCALLFTLIEGQLSAGTDFQNAIQLAQIGHEHSATASTIAEYEAEHFAEVK